MKVLLCALLFICVLAIVTVPSVTGQAACMSNCGIPSLTTPECAPLQSYVACLQKECAGDSAAQTTIDEFIKTASSPDCEIKGSGTTLVASLMTTIIAAVVSLVYRK